MGTWLKRKIRCESEAWKEVESSLTKIPVEEQSSSKKESSVGEGRNHRMVQQHDVEEREQGRRLGNGKRRD
jgi:hypothetical protein